MKLKRLAEKYLGTAILPHEWNAAKAAAVRKLRWIIEREGDADGNRREPWYLAQLIAETISASRFSRITYELCACALETKEKPAT